MRTHDSVNRSLMPSEIKTDKTIYQNSKTSLAADRTLNK